MTRDYGHGTSVESHSKHSTEGASIESASRIALSAIPIISLKDTTRDFDFEFDFLAPAIDDESYGQTETLSASPKYARPHGRAWRSNLSQLLKLNEVEDRIRLKRAKIYELIEAGDFPAPIKLSPGRSAWLADDVAAWVHRKAEESRKMAGGSDER